MAFMDYSSNIRKLIYTTNLIEGVHRIIRKVNNTKGAWSSDIGSLKQIYLTLTYSETNWKRNISYRLRIKRELIDQFGKRYSKYLE